MKKKTVTKKTTKRKADHPQYVIIDGYAYERLEKDSVNVEIELEDDVLAKLDKLITNGTYVSRGDAVRDILRQMIREKSKK